jgi:hypothetical protein
LPGDDLVTAEACAEPCAKPCAKHLPSQMLHELVESPTVEPRWAVDYRKMIA